MTSTTPPKPSSILPVCSAPDVRTPPEFRVPFRHPFSVKKVFEVFPPNPDQSSPPSPELACVAVPQLDVQATFDARFEQVWTLQKLAVGDLASTMSLAPLERLVLEVKTSQRTTLERTALESSESVESAEATIHDTETVNVARSNTTTTNWHVDGNGSIVGSLGSLNLAGGYSKNVTQTTQYSQNRLNERTQKSASSLKTLHKIEIKGASEAIVEDRQLRILRNPYRDRALTLNFFQLLKHFQVTTSLTEPRLAFVIRITDMIMEEAFIVANVDFLSKHLLDDNLRNNLAQAVEVARPGTGHREQQSPIAVAKTALRFFAVGGWDLGHERPSRKRAARTACGVRQLGDLAIGDHGALRSESG